MFFEDCAHGLSGDECRELLGTTNVGHICVNIDSLPVVWPVRYGNLGESLVLGVNDGPVQRALTVRKVVALGVDDPNLAEPFWSVVVIGRTVEVAGAAEHDEIHRVAFDSRADAEHLHFLRLEPDVITGAGVPA